MKVDLLIGKSQAGIAVHGGDPQWFAVATVAEAVERCTQALQASRARVWGRAKATVWLTGALARPFIFRAQGTMSADERLQIAKQLAGKQLGSAAFDGPVWVDEGAAGDVRLAAAMDSSVLMALARPDFQRLASVRHIRPWWGAALRLALTDDRQPSSTGLVAVSDGEALTVLGGTAGQFALARTYAESGASADGLLSRLLIEEPEMEGPVVVATMCRGGSNSFGSGKSCGGPFAASIRWIDETR